MRLLAPVTTGYFFPRRALPLVVTVCRELSGIRKLPLEPRVTSFWGGKNKLLFHRSLVNKGNSSTQCFFVKMKTGGYRAFLNLKNLNQYFNNHHYKMEACETSRASFAGLNILSRIIKQKLSLRRTI